MIQQKNLCLLEVVWAEKGSCAFTGGFAASPGIGAENDFVIRQTGIRPGYWSRHWSRHDGCASTSASFASASQINVFPRVVWGCSGPAALSRIS